MASPALNSVHPRRRAHCEGATVTAGAFDVPVLRAHIGAGLVLSSATGSACPHLARQ